MPETTANQPQQTHILVVDDEQDIRDLIEDILIDEGYSVSTAADGASARRLYGDTDFDLVLLDIWMPDADGISLLQEWQQDAPLSCPVVMMSGHGNIETAVQATRLGASDFIEKPLSLRKLLATVEQTLQAKSDVIQSDSATVNMIDDPVGKSSIRIKLRSDLQQLVKHNNHCTISGPAGVRKTDWLIWINQHSSTSENRLQITSASAVNNAETPLPTRGTLIIEHAGELDKAIQHKLARWSKEAHDGERRLMLATNESLRYLGQQGVFSTEFCQLFGGAVLELLPLQQHSEDLPELIRYYTDTLPDRHQLTYRAMTLPAQNCLRQHNWPGNERELADFIHQLLLLGESGDIELAEVTQALADKQEKAITISLPIAILTQPLREAREDFEREYLSWHLQQAGGSVGQMANTVGMERTHLYRKLRGLGLDPKTLTGNA